MFEPRATRVSLQILLFLSCTLLSACGGGGGDDDPTPAALVAGDYCFVILEMVEDTTDHAVAQIGTVTADGAGGLSGSLAANDAGTVLPPAALLASSYTVSAAHEIALTIEGILFTGRINADGSTALAASTAIGNLPAVLVMTRLGEGHATIELNADYQSGGFTADVTGQAIARWGIASLNGLGSSTYTAFANIEGSPVSPGLFMDPYAVSADGSLSHGLFGTTGTTGCLFGGPEAFFSAASIVNGEAPLLSFFVRETTGATDALLSGIYQIIGLERNGAGGFTSTTGTAVSDGAGGLQLDLKTNVDGTIIAPPIFNLSYAITATGKVTTTGGSGPLEGGVSPTGNFAALAGATLGPANPVCYFLMKM